ncbi:hypothetical protein [Gimesia sp.]|uniref:hypothetical protein n=1 Tax=Gimesia sp. TaxID=2024833 RepID=UPI003A90D8E7
MAGEVIAWRPGYGDSAEATEGPAQNYTETFVATLRTKNTSPVAIFKYRECPKRGERHRDDPAAYVSRIRPVRIGQTRLWMVTIDYTTDITSASNEADPLKRPAIITVDTVMKEVKTFFDGDGKLLINTAGDLTPGITEIPFQIYTVRKNVADIPDWFLGWPGGVNERDFILENKVFKARTMRLEPTKRPEKVLENGKWYYPLEYSLKYDSGTHDSIEPSMGFHELIPGKYIKPGTDPGDINISNTNTLIKTRIKVGTPPEYPKEPQFLDKNGRLIVLEEDKKRGGIDLSKIYIMRRNKHRKYDFSVLPVT